MDNADHAAAAEGAVIGRHLRKLWCIPGTALGRSGWPPTFEQRLHRKWNYWWQAHLLDCLVDAELRDPSPRRATTIARLARTVRLRNRLSWTNSYYDDMAWLGLALHRANAVTGLDVARPLADIGEQLQIAWTRDAGGGIWWRRGDDVIGYKNTPANGPAAILHARVGEDERARDLAVWITENLVDPDTGLVWDGLRIDRSTGEVTEVVKRIYTYCQGVYLGACLEMYALDGDGVWIERIERTVDAVERTLAPSGVLRGHGGGDGGLFSGILARYLSLVVRERPDSRAATTARTLVLTSAEACWANAASSTHGPLFGADWAKEVESRRPDEKSTARHLSVQLGAWMLLEAAATC